MRCRSPSGYLQWNAAPDGGDGKHIPPACAPLPSSFSCLAPSSSSSCIAVLFTHTHTRTSQKPPICLPLWNVCSPRLFESRRFWIKDLPESCLPFRWFCKIKDHSAVYSEAPYNTQNFSPPVFSDSNVSPPCQRSPQKIAWPLKKCVAKTPSSGCRPLMTSQRCLSEVSDNTPNQLFVSPSKVCLTAA